MQKNREIKNKNKTVNAETFMNIELQRLSFLLLANYCSKFLLKF
jgi:hypothetical protein